MDAATLAWLVPLLRLAKWLGVMAVAAGTVGAFLPRALDDRQRAAYLVLGPGFGVSWLAGFGLAHARGISLLEPWLLAAMALSMLSLNAVLYAVGREGRRTPRSGGVALVSLAATVVLMVYQPR